MKKVLIFWVLVICAGPVFSQTIYIANSSPGAVGGTRVFTGSNSINSAIAAASTGDIIYVVPSSVVYTQPTLGGKGVTLIGGGFNPDKANGALSQVGGIYGNANNWRVSGIVFTTEVNIPGTFNNIMIDKCRLKGGVGDGSGGSAKGNLIIQNCLIEGSPSGSAPLYIGSGSTGVRISNNIIYVISPAASGATRLNAATIENNIFIGASGSSIAAFNTVTNSDIKNNIFYGVRPLGTVTFTDNVLQNNLSFGASDNTYSTSNGNTSINNVENSDPQFESLPFGTGTFYNFSFDPRLKVGSPAIGTGINGIDMGIFGGPTPYDIYGTSLPLVQSIEAPASHTQGTNMNVRVQAKGN